MNKCDVIIPIYNAYDCLSSCIDSVIKNTNLEENRLILIDDKSPDDRVLPLLKKYTNGKSIILLENDVNLGFVGTVNRGMKYSTNDVLLLNSDTEVSTNWLDNIKAKAYSEPKVASVTPLSNNATLVSVPKGLQRNELPLPLKEYEELINKIAFNDSIEMATAHGYCMYIRREALDLVGFFDEETFGKGYGEENDFSFRCLDYGYKHLVCDNTIIYHKESQSFSEKKLELQKTNSKILQDRYPIYVRRNELWCQNFPLKKVCENIDYQLGLNNRKNILILIHDWSDVKNNVGGTTIHVLDLIMHLREYYNFHVLAPSDGIYKLYSYFKDSEKETKFGPVDSCNIIPMYSQKYKKMIEDIVEGFRIDTVHIHHMIGHCFDIADVIKEHKLYSMITLHDLYALCPTINMLYNMEQYCGDIKNPNCKECISHKTGLHNDVIPSWRDEWSNFLKVFDKIIVPSNDTKYQMKKVYKDLDFTVIEHGVESVSTDYIPSIEDKKQYNVAFVGVMAKHKGADILKDLIEKHSNSNVCFHLFGTSDYPELKRNKHNYVFHGKYKRNDITKLLENYSIDLVCLLSICPETYSYTLTEVINSKVPPISFDLGAVKERIEKNNIGWTISYKSNSEDVWNKINEVLNDKQEYAKVVEHIKSYHVKTSDEMANDYKPFYDTKKLIKINDTNIAKMKSIIENNYEIKETVSSAEAAWILNSLKWKIVSKIKVPEFAKKIVKKVINK